MTITNYMLNNLAKALSGQSFDVPTHNIVGSTPVITIDITQTDLLGVIGDASSLISSRIDNVVEFNTLRNGSLITNPDGDEIKSIGVTTAATGGILQAGVPTNELQTTAFDIEMVWQFSIDRT